MKRMFPPELIFLIIPIMLICLVMILIDYGSNARKVYNANTLYTEAKVYILNCQMGTVRKFTSLENNISYTYWACDSTKVVKQVELATVQCRNNKCSDSYYMREYTDWDWINEQVRKGKMFEYK